MFGEVAYVGEDEALGLLACAQMAAALPCSALLALQPQKICHGSPAPCCRTHRGSWGRGAARGSSPWTAPSQSERGKQQRHVEVSVSQVVPMFLYGTSRKGTEETSPASSPPARCSITLAGAGCAHGQTFGLRKAACFPA